ncbi:MAG: DUF1501 domain-containing protein [Acidobacteria bacterium]|nr:DUF1501 domain-containing protein [Acidobacteriota bacterium]
MSLAWSRRHFLRIGSLATGGLTLPTLLRASNRDTNINCIILFMSGGPSQLETFDPKPDAPPEVRGNVGVIPTKIPGVRFSELIPRCAQMADKFTVIRSMHSREAIHEKAKQYLFTGTRPGNAFLHPCVGSVVARELGPKNGLPPFVVTPSKDIAAEAGFLGSSYDPFVAGNPNVAKFTVKDLTLPLGIGMEEAQSRARLLAAIDGELKRVEKSELISSLDEFQQKALDLIASPAAKKAFEIDSESPKLRDTYGRNAAGQGALLARRLVEHGVRLVSVFHGGYDTHTDNEKTSRRLMPEFDQAFTALLDDVSQRGLLDTTLILAMGEFGRTPKINFSAGRDHWPGSFSVAIAGAGVPPGQIIGSTDEHAAAPADRPIAVEDLVAAIYKKMGVDYTQNYHAFGRPIAILKEGTPVRELFT